MQELLIRFIFAPRRNGFGVFRAIFPLNEMIDKEWFILALGVYFNSLNRI